MSLRFDEYQKQAYSTNLVKDDKLLGLMQNVLGISDEAGEVLGKFKKWIRDQDADFSKLDTEAITKEMGDVLWYLAVVAEDMGVSLDDIAQENLKKLASRKTRNTLRGSGDNR